MSRSMRDIRRELARYAASKRTHEPALADFFLKVSYGHDDERCFLVVNPLPPNGVVAFTRAQYAAAIEELQKVLASFDARQLEIKATQQ